MPQGIGRRDPSAAAALSAWKGLWKSWEVDLQRRTMFQLLAGGAIGSGRTSFAIFSSGTDQAAENHVAWVIEVFNKMRTIIPGMTRDALYQVFTTEGGLSTGLQRTFVSRDCPYFKVDVEFKAVGRPDRDGDGRVTLVENGMDVILKISRAYLELSIMD
jgi:hypothetical protein